MYKIPVAKPHITDQDAAMVYSTVNTGRVTSGPMVQKFEEAFAQYVGRKYAVMTSSGSAALDLALAPLRKYYSSVIGPDLSYHATYIAPKHNHMLYLAGEVDIYGGLRADEVLSLSDNTFRQVIMPVDLFGIPVSYDKLEDAVSEVGRWKHEKPVVIVDAAESLGSSYKYRPCGSMGDAAIFSFYGNKLITTGEGGMFVTDSEGWAREVRHYMNHCMVRQYEHDGDGWNYAPNEMAAALGYSQLSRIGLFLEQRRTLRNRYEALLGEYLLSTRRHAIWNNWTVVAFPMRAGASMMRFRLGAMGIETRPVFSTFSGRVGGIADRFSRNAILLPMYHELSFRDIDHIADAWRTCDV